MLYNTIYIYIKYIVIIFLRLREVIYFLYHNFKKQIKINKKN